MAGEKILSQADQNAKDFADSIDDLIGPDKRETLTLPKRGTFERVIMDAQHKINLDPKGRFDKKQ